MKYLLMSVGIAASLCGSSALAAGAGQGGCGDGDCLVGKPDRTAGHVVSTATVGDMTAVVTGSLGFGKQGRGGHVTVVITTDGEVTCSGTSSGGFGVGGGRLNVTISGDCP